MQKPSTAPKGLNRDQIWDFYLDGFGPTQIARKLGVVRSTVIHHLKQLKKEKEAIPDRTPPLTTETSPIEESRQCPTYYKDSTISSSTTKGKNLN